MSYFDEMDLVEQVARLTARVAELEERLSRLESGGFSRSASAGNTAESGPASPLGNDELLSGIQVVLERLGEAEAGQIRQELIKNGLPAALSRSDINKVLYRHTELFTRANSDASKPQWRLV